MESGFGERYLLGCDEATGRSRIAGMIVDINEDRMQFDTYGGERFHSVDVGNVSADVYGVWREWCRENSGVFWREVTEQYEESMHMYLSRDTDCQIA